MIEITKFVENMKIFSIGMVLISLCNPITVAAAVCPNSLTTPTSNFTIHQDGTVTHNRTGLMWKVCAQGMKWSNTNTSNGCTGTAEKYNWQQALQVPETLNSSGGYAGYTDWRLPNIKELGSIVEYNCYFPTINEEVFPEFPNHTIWTSTPFAYLDKVSWTISFINGGDYIHRRTDTDNVILVRSGR
jgi:hypothetical protein